MDGSYASTLAKLTAKGNATYGIDATPLKGGATPQKGNATYGVDGTPLKCNATYGIEATPTKTNATYEVVEEGQAAERKLYQSTVVEEQHVGPAAGRRDDSRESSTDDSRASSAASHSRSRMDDSVEVQSLVYSRCDDEENHDEPPRPAGRDSSASSNSVASSHSSAYSHEAGATPSPASSPDVSVMPENENDTSFLPPNISAISKAILSASSDSPTELGRMIIQLSQQAEAAKKV